VWVGGLVALGLTAGASTADLEALQRAWSGSHDSREEVTVSSGRPDSSGTEPVGERRVRTLVAPVRLAWSDAPGLYLEEFLHDDPDDLRRQLLVKLEPAGTAAHEIRARLFTFLHPRRWAHLQQRPQLTARLTPQDLQSDAGCDLLLARRGEQFEGGTAGAGCLADGGAFYVDYQVVIGEGLYWYRRRLIRRSDGALKEEVIGFNWFELNEARLFTCRIDWSATGRPQDLKPLKQLDLHDKGGHGELTTPDGRRLVLTLHSQDWPFAAEHDALVLLLSEPGQSAPLASAWAVVDEDRIALWLRWLRVRCGAVEPSGDEVHG
jgi:hypothetical protein